MSTEQDKTAHIGSAIIWTYAVIFIVGAIVQVAVFLSIPAQPGISTPRLDTTTQNLIRRTM